MNTMLRFQEIQTGCAISNLQSRKKLRKQGWAVLVASDMAVKENHHSHSDQPHKLLHECEAFEDWGSIPLTMVELDCFFVSFNSFFRHEESIQLFQQVKPKWGLISGNFPDPQISGSSN
jgi:hypothetical protein